MVKGNVVCLEAACGKSARVHHLPKVTNNVAESLAKVYLARLGNNITRLHISLDNMCILFAMLRNKIMIYLASLIRY